MRDPRRSLNPAMLDQLLRCCARIGDMQVAQQQHAAASAHTKPDGTPVCAVDTASEQTLKTTLNALSQTYWHQELPMVSEEQTEAENLKAIQSREAVWVVDPLDGTGNYVHGGKDYAIQIALLSPPDAQGQRQPTFGLLYMPASREVFFTGLRGNPVQARLAPTRDKGPLIEGDLRPLAPASLLSPPVRRPDRLRIGLGMHQADTDAYRPLFAAMSANPVFERTDARSMKVIGGMLDAACCDHPLAMWDVAGIDAIARAGKVALLPVDAARQCVTAHGLDYRALGPQGNAFRMPPYITVPQRLLQHVPYAPELTAPANAAATCRG